MAGTDPWQKPWEEVQPAGVGRGEKGRDDSSAVYKDRASVCNGNIWVGRRSLGFRGLVPVPA